MRGIARKSTPLGVVGIVWMVLGSPSWANSIALGGSAPLKTWAFQDGSLTVSDQGLTFSYLPFLSMLPAWSPALPQYEGQPVEPVRPLPGLGGILQFGIVQDAGIMTPLRGSLLESSPNSGKIGFEAEGGALVLAFQTGLDRRGVFFEISGLDRISHPLRMEIVASPQRILWAKPGKKERHDWGSPQWEWSKETNCLIQSYTSPVDATRSMTTGLWFGKEVHPEVSIDVDPKGLIDSRVCLTIPPTHKGNVRFAFLHADNRFSFDASIQEVKDLEFQSLAGEWQEWLEDSHARINRAFVGSDTGELTLSESDREVMDRRLVQARQLFLSNGMVLQGPMTPSEFPYSLKSQGIGLRYWKKMGLENPFAGGWRDLVQFNPAMERTLPIVPFSGDDIRKVLRSGPFVITAPDPKNPPTKEAFDILLGFIIDGGNVTLVDGSSGFRGKTGWWTEAGAADPADYALRVLKAPIDFESRKVLDSEGVDPHRNTFALGMEPVEITSATKVAFRAKGKGFLFVCAKNEEDPKGILLRDGRFGDQSFRCWTASEGEVLSASHQPEVGWSSEGGIEGRRLRGEGFAVYRLPAGASTVCEFDIDGEAAFFFSEKVPETHHQLLKKVVQSWYHRALLSFPVSRAAHPVVYSGTYTCRVFDVTGTETSPVLFHKVGRGSLAWVGLPVDSIRLGTDGGTDAQRSLREDPFYDLLRMTLALHDPRQAGAQQAGVTPNWVWTDRLNVRSENPPTPETIFFAWESIREMGAGAGNRIFWGWALSSFTESLRATHWPRERVQGTSLDAVSLEGKKWTDLSLQAFQYSVYKDLQGAAGNLERTWHSRNAEEQANRIEDDLEKYFHLDSPTPSAARVVVDGTLTEEIPLDRMYAQTLLAVALLEGKNFPGGDEARTSYLNQLLGSVPENPTPFVIGLLSGLDPTRFGKEARNVLENDMEVSDLATLVPSIYGLCLKSLSEGTE